MPPESLKDFTELLYEHLTDANWPDLVFDDSELSVMVDGKKIEIIKIQNGQYQVALISYVSDSGVYDVYGGMSFSFDIDLDPSIFIYLGNPRGRQVYGMNESALVRLILQTREGKHAGCSNLNISSRHSKLSFSKKTKVLKIPYTKYVEVITTAQKISKKGQSYRNSVTRYLVNQASEKYINVVIEKKTNVSKGEYSFLTKRFNLATKSKKEHFLKYMDKEDVTSLQELTMSMIDKEIFDLSYLKKLDAYFLKEKLEDIVNLGNKIIDLKSTDLTTHKAQAVISLLYRDEVRVPAIKQLETLWQRYFEKYLLYLIFTYKQIHSKIELKFEGNDKYPDFIGINHYNGVDVIEIKTHLKPALVNDGSHDNFAFSSDLSKAIIQTTNYMDAIKERAFVNKQDLINLVSETEQENLYRPRGIIIISSTNNLVKNQSKYSPDKIRRDFTKLRNSLGGIEILTFNEILDIASAYSAKIAIDINSV